MNSSKEVAESYGYTQRPINVDLGVSIRSAGNRRVLMYKSMPGMYLNAGGGFVSDDEAREAGFDIETDRRKAERDGKLSAYKREVMLQHAENEARIRAGLDPELVQHITPIASAPAAPAAPVDPVTERNADGAPRGTTDFKLEHIGGGRWNVMNRADQTMIESKLVEDDAISVMVKAQLALDDSRSSG